MLKRRIDLDFDPGANVRPSGSVRGCVKDDRAGVQPVLNMPAVARPACSRPSVGEGMRLVREPDAGDLHVRLDERRLETEPWSG